MPDVHPLKCALLDQKRNYPRARSGNSPFPAAKGNPATINQTAQNVVDDILTTPGSTIQNGNRGRFGPTLEVTAPDGRGIVYDANGKFLFFKQ